jgi:hypothetical protein
VKNFFDDLVSDEAMLAAISEVGGKLYELEGHLKTTSKVVHGKIRSMLKRDRLLLQFPVETIL